VDAVVALQSKSFKQILFHINFFFFLKKRGGGSGGNYVCNFFFKKEKLKSH